MAATQDLHLDVREVQNVVRGSIAIASAATVYQHSFVGLTSGTGRALVAGDAFLGLAARKFVQADGDTRVEYESGFEIKKAVTGASAETDRNSLVYASDDQTATLTKGSNSLIGVVIEWLTGTTCWIYLFTQAELKAMAEPST